MSELQTFKTNGGIEIIINQATGESFCSVSGYARMSGKARSTIHNRLNKGCRDSEPELVEMLTAGGIQGVRLVSEELISDWIVDDNPAVAKQLIKLGARLFLHKLAGFEVKSSAIKEPKTNPALQAAKDCSEIQGLMANNPRIAQILVDSTINFYLEDLPALPGSAPKLRGVVEIAHEMGFKTNLSTRVTLGQFIAPMGFTRYKEKRLCNGQMQPINCYEDTPELRDAITKFFTH